MAGKAGMARPVQVGRVTARLGRQGIAGLGRARPGEAGPGRRGVVRRGESRLGMARQAWRGTA